MTICVYTGVCGNTHAMVCTWRLKPEKKKTTGTSQWCLVFLKQGLSFLWYTCCLVWMDQQCLPTQSCNYKHASQHSIFFMLNQGFMLKRQEHYQIWYCSSLKLLISLRRQSVYFRKSSGRQRQFFFIFIF